VQLER